MQLFDDIISKWSQYKSKRTKVLQESLTFEHSTISHPYYIFLENMAGNAHLVELSLTQISKSEDDLSFLQEHLSDLTNFIQKLEPSVGKLIAKDETRLEEILGHKANKLSTAQANLFEMYLIYIVSVFEGFIQNIHYEIFVNYPKTMHSNKTLTYKEILAFPNSAELEKYIARLEASKSTEGTPEEYLKRAFKRFGIKSELNRLCETPELSLIIDIRNLLVHNNGRVDKQFLHRNPEINLQEGEKIKISATNISELAETIRLHTEMIESIFTIKFPAISKINWSDEIEGWLMDILNNETNKKESNSITTQG